MKSLQIRKLSKGSIINLLNYQDRKTTREIHTATGADFNAEISVVVGVGTFTASVISKCLAEMDQSGADYDKNKIVYVLFDAPRYCNKYGVSKDSENRHAIFEDGKLRNQSSYGSGFRWGSGFDNCFGIGDLHEKRKFAEFFAVLVLNKGIKRENEKTADPGTRYQAVKFNRFCHSFRGATFSNEVTLKNNNDVITGHFSEVLETETARIVDKSGYFVPIFKAELMRKLRALKAERAETKARNIDKAADLHNLVMRFEDVKKKTAEAIQGATLEDSAEAAEMAHRFSWNKSDIIRAIKKIQADAFRSPEEYADTVRDGARAYLKIVGC